MARNFRVCIHRNGENLHLTLKGDFDGTSAYELVNALKKNVFGVYSIFIHTNGLKTIEPFGRDVFHRNLPNLNNQRTRIMFTGEKADQLAMEGSKIC